MTTRQVRWEVTPFSSGLATKTLLRQSTTHIKNCTRRIGSDSGRSRLDILQIRKIMKIVDFFENQNLLKSHNIKKKSFENYLPVWINEADFVLNLINDKTDYRTDVFGICLVINENFLWFAVRRCPGKVLPPSKPHFLVEKLSRRIIL